MNKRVRECVRDREEEKERRTSIPKHNTVQKEVILDKKISASYEITFFLSPGERFISDRDFRSEKRLVEFFAYGYSIQATLGCRARRRFVKPLSS